MDGKDREREENLKFKENCPENYHVHDNEVLMVHHHHYNSVPLNNPFVTGPPSLSEVECTSPNSPLLAEGIHQLDHYLSGL